MNWLRRRWNSLSPRDQSALILFSVLNGSMLLALFFVLLALWSLR